MTKVLAFAADAAVLLAGIIVAVLLYNGTVHGAPWSALAIFLVGFAGVGAIALVVAHAHRVEAQEAQPHHHQGPEQSGLTHR